MVKNRLSVALFGGSFDPPHIGHQTIVKKVLNLELVDRLIIMPTFLNPFKSSSHATADMRLKWCKDIFSNPDVIICDYEIRQDRPVYTIESIRYLQGLYDLKYLVIGSDNLAHIESWREFEIINSTTTWIVVGRSGYESGYEKLRDYITIEMDIPISSSQIRAGEQSDSIDRKIRDDLQNINK